MRPSSARSYDVHGLHSAQLDTWRTEARKAAVAALGGATAKRKRSPEQRETRRLEREDAVVELWTWGGDHPRCVPHGTDRTTLRRHSDREDVVTIGTARLRHTASQEVRTLGALAQGARHQNTLS